MQLLIAKLKKLLTSFMVVVVFFGTFAPYFNANAQFTDPVNAPLQPQQLAWQIVSYFDQVSTNVYDKSKDFTDDILDNLAAIVYKQGVGTILSAVAAETARQLASAERGKPVFTFKKEFFRALADGVVGDMLNDIVNGLTGINLCNLDAQYTLNVALALPLFKEYEYSPRCSLTQIAESVENFDIKNVFQLNVKITTVDSLEKFYDQFTADPVTAVSNLGAAIGDLKEKYSNSNSEFNKQAEKDTEVVEKVMQAQPNETVNDDKGRIVDVDYLKERLTDYRCNAVADLQNHNLAILDGKDIASDTEYKDMESECTTILKDKSQVDFKQWNAGDANSWQKKAYEWVSVNESQRSYYNNVIRNMEQAASSKSTPIEKAVARAEYNYNTCFNALKGLLNVTVDSSSLSATSSATNLTTDLSIAPFLREGTFSILDSSNTLSNKLIIVGWKDDIGIPYAAYTTDGTEPVCDPNALTSYIVQGKGGTWETPEFPIKFERDNSTVTLKAKACIPAVIGDLPQPAFETSTKTFQYTYSTSATASGNANLEECSGSSCSETFTALLADPNNPGFTTEATLRYSYRGKKLTEEEYISCQIAFNSGVLLRSFWESENTAGIDFNYVPGANKFPKNGKLLAANESAAPILRTSVNEAFNPYALGDFNKLFHPKLYSLNMADFKELFIPVNRNIKVETGPDMVQAFLRKTVAMDVEASGSGAALRKIVLDAIGGGQLMMRGFNETITKKQKDIEEVYSKAIKKLTELEQNQLSADERAKETAKEASAENQKNALSSITKRVLDEKYDKKEEEIVTKTTEGTLVNAPRTGVSERAESFPEVFVKQADNVISGNIANIGGYTGQILADTLNAFMSTFLNTLITRGYTKLNQALSQEEQGGIISIQGNSELDARASDFEACQQDPDGCTEPFAGIEYSRNNQPCTPGDLDILRALNRLDKALGSVVKTGVGSDGQLSPKCVEALKKEEEIATAKGRPVDLGEVLSRMLGFINTTEVITSEPASGRGPGRAPGSANPQIVLDTESSTSGGGQLPDIYTNSELATFASNFTQSEGEFVKEMQTCPRGDTNRSLYNCTINAKFTGALQGQYTLKQAIDKKIIKSDAVIGVTNDGKEPDTETGFSLGAVQKLRKLRILPLGLEFAARLKVACYQSKKSADGSELPKTGPYRDIRDECYFGDGANKITSASGAVFEKYRDAVVAANLQTIIDGFGDTGGTTSDCSYFGLNPDGSLTTSPFCGLVNPDWVVKLPKPKCENYAPGEILENTKSNKRIISCTSLASDLGNGQFGYCVKEQNVWKVDGPKCDGQYSTCTAYTFKDGTGAAFNRNSLIGEGICNPNNAGCVWFSTIRQGSLWIDTQSLTSRVSCLAAGGRWNGVSCSNSRVYLNDNIETCGADQSGCSELKLLKVEGNNMVMNGGFEYGEDNSIDQFWKSSKITNDAQCLNGVKSTLCSNVEYRDFATCTAQGGTFNEDTQICTNAVISGATEDRCGVCIYEGTDRLKDSSRSIFSKTECENETKYPDHTWYGVGNSNATFETLCNAGEITCSSDAGRCYVDFSDNDGNQAGCVQLGGSYFEFGCLNEVAGIAKERSNDTAECEAGYLPVQNICTSQTNGQRRIEKTDVTNALVCNASGGEFEYICPLKTVSTDTFSGVRSLRIDLTQDLNNNILVGDRIDSYYKIDSPDETTLFVPGDTFSMQFIAKAVSGSQDISSIPTRIELVKTFKDGRVDKKTLIADLDSSYRRYSMSLTAITSGTDLALHIIAPAQEVESYIYIDNVKIEYNSPSQILSNSILVGPYTEYTDNQNIFMKTAPEYLGCRGYNSQNPAQVISIYPEEVSCRDNGLYWDSNSAYGLTPRCYRYPPDSNRCGDYARVCKAEEAGCQLYTPTNGEPEVPGVVGQNDYCPAECNGYETFKQQPSYFEPAAYAPINYFIPNTAQQCTVADVGCDEFTDITLGAATGNPISHYTYLRQCVTPSAGNGEAGFFIWQGSSDGPPQLRTFTLQAVGGDCYDSTTRADLNVYDNNPEECKVNNGIFEFDGTGGPNVISADGFCSEGDLGVNLDCLRFYDNAGNSYLRKLSYTIEANPECTVLRKTVSDQSSCERTNGKWENNECLYNALPSASRQCNAQVSGCREYLGNTGNNSQNIFFDSFEGATTHSWFNGAVSGVEKPALSAESITTLGRSIEVSDATNAVRRSAPIENGKSYKVSFWAKSKSGEAKNLAVRFSSGESRGIFADTSNAKARVGSEWSYYELGPIFVEWNTPADNQLVIENVGGVYLDNIILTVLRDRVYVVKNSWNTPTSCNVTNLGAQMPQAQLGCQEYNTSSNTKTYLKSFAKLCRSSSVGCQLVFDTRNSKTPLEKTYNTENISTLDDVTVYADRLMAVVVEQSKLCQSQNKGCSEVGLVESVLPTAGATGISLYVKNDPDKYQSALDPILCTDETLGCVELRNSRGDKEYLKVDFTKTCRYDAGVSGWVKSNGSGKGCLASDEQNQNDCVNAGKSWNAQHGQCVTDVPSLHFNNCTLPHFTKEYTVSLRESCVSDYKGYWYFNGASGCGCARNPYEYYTSDEYPDHEVSPAICPAAQDRCTEFKDFNPNYIYNGDFEITDSADSQLTDRWNVPLKYNFAGRAISSQDYKKSGSRSIKLIKDTYKELPMLDYGDGKLIDTPFYVRQQIGRLEKGNTYELDFSFHIDPEAGRGVLSFGGDSGFCPIPDIAYEVVPSIPSENLDFISTEDFDYTNRANVRVVSSVGGWKDVNGKFVVPSIGTALPLPQEIPAGSGADYKQTYCTDVLGASYSDEGRVVTTIATQSVCVSKGFNWIDPDGAGEEPGACYANCFVNDLNDPYVDYEVRIYGPLNGACVNKQTGEKRYFDSKGRAFDKFTCEGAISSDLEAVGNADDFILRYEGYEDRFTAVASGFTMLDADGNAPSNNNAWEWQGNCRESSVTVDMLQIAPKRSIAADTRYFMIDKGGIDKSSCRGAVDWDAGCIQFKNEIADTNEVLKVKPDRSCGEWLYCNNRDAKGRCVDWTTCVEQKGDVCVRYGSKADLLRYQLDDDANLESVSIENYQNRLGSVGALRMSRWRAGDYSGYTIPNLPPIEQLYNAIPGSYFDNNPQALTSAGTTEFIDDLVESNKKVSNAYINGTLADAEYNLPLICKIYPDATAPFPTLLKALLPNFANVNAFSDAFTRLEDRLSACRYYSYKAKNADLYYSKQPADGEGIKVCINEGSKGVLCQTDLQCGENPTNEDGSHCVALGDILSGTATSKFKDVADKDAFIKSLSPKVYQGVSGVCIEEDPVIKITGGLVDIDNDLAITDPDSELNQANETPNACLTFMPE